MKSLFTTVSGVVFGLFLLFGTNVMAQASAAQSPQAIVESVAQELFDLVKAKNAGKTADDVYFKQVEGSLDGVVNFPFIAASVMGKAYKQATPAQRQEFQRRLGHRAVDHDQNLRHCHSFSDLSERGAAVATASF